MTSDSFSPRVSWSRVALSRALANWANAASARYWARSGLGGPAAFFIGLIRAAEPTGRAPEEERHLAVGPGVLREVVVDAQRVLHGGALELDALLHDLLAHRDAGVRREVLERGRLFGAGDHHDRVVHRAVPLEDRHG